MIEKVLKYQGNEKYICILCSNKKDELFVFYALTGKLCMEINKETINYEISCHKPISCSFLKNCEIKIPIIAAKQSDIIKIDSEEEYNRICCVVESLT